MRYKYILIAILVCLTLVGCGYTTGSLLPSYLKTIYIEDFKNEIDISSEPSDKRGFVLYRAGIENRVTSEIIDRFIYDGNLQVVSNRNDADLILKGSLLDYYKQPLRYDKFDNVEEYRIILTVNIELNDMVEKKKLWQDEKLTGYESYRLTGSLAKTEEEAQDEAIKDLAQRVVEKVIEGW